MRVLIASGIYPPEIGGPALYAYNVKLALEDMGHKTSLVLFSPYRRYPSGLRHLLYTMRLFSFALRVDAIFAFDTYSVGLPAAVVGFILGKKVVIRVGGDFVWEHYIERTKQPVTLPSFYVDRPVLNGTERLARSLVRWMTRHAILAFNTAWQLEIWQRGYGFKSARAHVVSNVIDERVSSEGSDTTVLVYGRDLFLKNADAFRRAFAKAGVDLALETGALPHDEFMRRLSHAHAVAVPSISDVAPNVIIDALRCNKPFILTKYSGYSEQFAPFGIIIDPLDESDMTHAVQQLADSTMYEVMCRRIATFRDVRTYADVTREMLALVNV